MGFRTEQLYGEGFRDPAEVMAHEVFELGNTDILDTLSETIFKGSEIGEKLNHLSKVMSGELVDEELENFLNDAREYEVGVSYMDDIVFNIETITGRPLNYVMWLCDSTNDIIDAYENNIDHFAEFMEYPNGYIVLSDIGKGGKLYGYEEKPNIISIITRNVYF